jgi:uncharacterized protein
MGNRVTAFLGDGVVARGERTVVTRLIEDGYAAGDRDAIRAFDDETGKLTDLDYWDAAQSHGEARPAPAARGRGRPKLGVTAREITLLPRHWDWLAKQPAGASATIRRLVDQAERAGRGGADTRRARDAAYHFMNATSGDRPGYEEALRALYRGEMDKFDALTASWPEDIRAYIDRLLQGGEAEPD